MTKVRVLTTILLSLFFATSAAANITLTIKPAVQTVPLGNTVDVAVNVSGLSEMTAPSMGAYDLDVLFDPSILSFHSIAFVSQLDLSIQGSVRDYDDSTMGVLNAYEVSLESTLNLNSSQSGNFDLFTLTFDTLAQGFSNLDISVTALGDAGGMPLFCDVIGARISVIPAPTAFMLGGLGLGLVNLLRHRKVL